MRDPDNGEDALKDAGGEILAGEVQTLDAPSALEQKDPLIGRVLDGHIEILEKLGEGGMGAVYKAKDNNLDRFVAVKFVLGLTETLLVRFKREMVTSGKLDHPNIIKVLATGDTDGMPFLIMEYLQGRSLDSVIAERGALTPSECKSLFVQACRGLEHAHKNGVLHRDIKPGNIMLVTSGSQTRVILLDFGVAKAQEFENQKLTQSGAIIGSALYMSPEQSSNATMDARSDLYSLFCVMYHALGGVPPFEGESMFEVMYKQIHEAPKPVPTLDADWNAFLKRGLDKDPEKRYQTPHDVIQALGALSGTPRTQASPSNSGRNLLACAGITAAIALVIAGGYVMRSKHNEIGQPVQIIRTKKEKAPFALDAVRTKAQQYERQATLLGAKANTARSLGDEEGCQKYYVDSRSKIEMAQELYQNWLAERGASAKPEDVVEAKVAIAINEVKRQNFKGALTRYLKLYSDPAMKEDCFALMINARIGQCYAELGDQEKAFLYLQKAAQVYTRRQRNNTMEPKIAYEGQNAALRYGDVALAMQRPDLAVKAYQDSIEFQVKFEPVEQRGFLTENYGKLANAYERLNNFDSAKKYHLLRLEVAEEQPDVNAEHKRNALSKMYMDYASFLHRSGHLEEAIKQYDRAIDLCLDKPLKSIALREKAEVLMKTDPQRATALLREAAIYVKDNDSDGCLRQRTAIAQDLFKLNLLDETEEMENQLLKCYLKRNVISAVDPLIYLSSIYEKRNQKELALKLQSDFERELEGRALAPFALVILGEHHASGKNYEAATRLWLKALNLIDNSKNSNVAELVEAKFKVLSDLVSRYYDLQDYATAAGYAERSVALCESDHRLSLERRLQMSTFLAQIYIRQHRRSEAAALLKKCLAINLPAQNPSMRKAHQLQQNLKGHSN